MKKLARSPLAWILAAALVVHLVGIGWGLPGSDAWEDDGIAPRDFLVGAYETYNPGHYFTYPPVHLLGLSLLTSPIWGLALARAPSLAPADVVPTMIQVPTMTALSIVARLVSQAMALGIIYVLAKLAEEVWGRRAGILVALVLAVCAPLTYYAHTSNLDVPYQFWACFGLLETVRAMMRGEPRRFRRALLYAALAVGTKDQAYAVFLGGFPLAVGAWLLVDPGVRGKRGPILRELAIAVAIAAGLFLLVSGAITNPSGFRERIHFLLGPASQNHANYPATLEGRLALLRALVVGFDRFWPWPFAAAALGGLGWHAATQRGKTLVAGLVPLLGGLSFVVFFNMTARRTEHRFAMPEMILIGLYAGVCFDRLLDKALRPAAALIGAMSLWGLYGCAAVDANLVLDPRYEAEAWLAANVHEGDVIEIYGANAYQLRYPRGVRVTRVDTSPLGSRNPLPNVTELQTPYVDLAARKPRFVVITDAFAWRWFAEKWPDGQVSTPEQAERERDRVTRTFFHDLYEGKLGYRLAHLSEFQSRLWPRLAIHASTSNSIRIFQREM